MTDDSLTDAAPPGNIPEYSVSEISQAVKRTVEGSFERVRVRGEISRPSFPSSGHVYFRLKDEKAVLDAVCWRSVAPRLSLRPEDGLEVICTGRLTTYPGKSSYQIVIESMELAGEGALLKLLEERRKKLAAEGLFEEARKRPLPHLPEVIGVVTSPSGAVIRDILHRLAERFPRHVLVWPVSVQGEQAAGQVAAAIEGFNALAPGGAVPRPDVLIVARGGGSLEDLWAFNEEIVVRAAAASDIPLISAVGHETDTTLIDFAADRRAPTPTAAAEIAVPVRSELRMQVGELGQRADGAMNRQLRRQRELLEAQAARLTHPRRLLEERMQRIDELGQRMGRAVQTYLAARTSDVVSQWSQIPHPRQQISYAGRSLTDLDRRLAELRPRLVRPFREELATAGRLLEGFSYHKTLERGFVVVRGAAGVITRAAKAPEDDAIELEFHDGRVQAHTGGQSSGGQGSGGQSSGGQGSGAQKPKAQAASQPKRKPKRPAPGNGDDPQGSLL
ncbi:MAG: exodeoxyribonuclease VII large subunit [Rhodovibrionaceae bacterium]|nr:exodeoxyribonuclease VII large subunit [Rhodovibrionaceae bacterium]